MDPAHFVSAPGLVWQACLKKTGVNLELLTNVDMLLMVEEGIRGGMCEAICRYAKSNNKYMKNCDKKINSSLSEVFRCKQFVWMCNVLKTSCKRFQMDKRKWYIKIWWEFYKKLRWKQW